MRQLDFFTVLGSGAASERRSMGGMRHWGVIRLGVLFLSFAVFQLGS